MRSLRKVLSFLGWLAFGFLVGIVMLFGFIFAYPILVSSWVTGWGVVFGTTILCGLFLVGVQLVRKRGWDLRAKGIAGGLGLFLGALWIVNILLERLFIAIN